METVTIKELSTKGDWLDAFSIIYQLRTHLDEEAYVSHLAIMSEQGYKLFALYDKKGMVAVAGVGISTNLYYGRHVWLYDFVTDSSHRSKGYGKQLLHFIQKWGMENGCEKIALSSGLQRKDAHRFYEDKMDYGKKSYVFLKDL